MKYKASRQSLPFNLSDSLCPQRLPKIFPSGGISWVRLGCSICSIFGMQEVSDPAIQLFKDKARLALLAASKLCGEWNRLNRAAFPHLTRLLCYRRSCCNSGEYWHWRQT